jgi:hypothetical protein
MYGQVPPKIAIRSIAGAETLIQGIAQKLEWERANTAVHPDKRVAKDEPVVPLLVRSPAGRRIAFLFFDSSEEFMGKLRLGQLAK